LFSSGQIGDPSLRYLLSGATGARRRQDSLCSDTQLRSLPFVEAPPTSCSSVDASELIYYRGITACMLTMKCTYRLNHCQMWIVRGLLRSATALSMTRNMHVVSQQVEATLGEHEYASLSAFASSCRPVGWVCELWTNHKSHGTSLEKSGVKDTKRHPLLRVGSLLQVDCKLSGVHVDVSHHVSSEEVHQLFPLGP
jgi:hypothetical protein